jgi:hypothetical protein
MSFFKSWKVRVTMIGGAIVIATTYGTCTIDPDEKAVKEAVEEKIEDAKKSDAPAEESKTEEKEEPKEVDTPKEEK